MSWTTFFYLVAESSWQTILMVAASTCFALLLGFPFGILLCITAKDNLLPRPFFHRIISRIVNVLRSIPFIILMILLFPLSRVLVGKSIGTVAAIVPLSIAAAPFVARIVETALLEVDSGVVLAATAMGSSRWQIIYKVLLPEALPSLVAGITLTIINLIGYSAMAGAIGGGGLGDLAIRYGYQRFRSDVMIAAVIVIVVMVEATQFIGTKISHAMLARR